MVRMLRVFISMFVLLSATGTALGAEATCTLSSKTSFDCGTPHTGEYCFLIKPHKNQSGVHIKKKAGKYLFPGSMELVRVEGSRLTGSGHNRYDCYIVEEGKESLTSCNKAIEMAGKCPT